MTGYRIAGLPHARFEHLFGLGDAALAKHEAARVIADAKPGFPCRITLEDAEPGETLILAGFEHHDVAGPYRARHAVYVREGATAAALFENEVPSSIALRLLSVRAFDAAGMMIGADVVEGDALEPLIGEMFADPRAAYLHLHNARPGCFAARVDRLSGAQRLAAAH